MDSTSHLRSRGFGIALLGPRSLGIVVSSLIFLTAIAAVILLARAPFGEIYGTLLGGAGNSRTASITLYGTSKPNVEMSVAEKENAQYIILSIEDATAKELTLTIPSGWHLEEARGVRASDIAPYAASERTTLMIPMIERSVELRFTTNEKFESVAFTHDASSPALFTLIHLTLVNGASEKKSEIVEESTMMEL